MTKSKIVFFSLLLTTFSIFSCCPKVSALSESQTNSIKDNCASLKTALSEVQKKDSRTRVYLGGYFETVLSDYLKPLNHRLIENDISNAEIVEEQTTFAALKTEFSTDFITYQKSLDSLIAIDCKTNPDAFYETLNDTRDLRAEVLSDVDSLKELILKHMSSVQLLREKYD